MKALLPWRFPEDGWGSSCRWEEAQPLSEPVEPERQREEEPELSVAADTPR